MNAVIGRLRCIRLLFLFVLAAFFISILTATSVENGGCDAEDGTCDDDIAGSGDDANVDIRMEVDANGDVRLALLDEGNDLYDEGDEDITFDEEAIIADIQRQLEKQISEGKFTLNMGEKIVKISDNEIDNAVPKFDSKTCVDEDSRCEFWASEGECEVNPVYMLGEFITSAKRFRV